MIGHLVGLADGLSALAEVELACGKTNHAKKYLILAGTVNNSLERKFNLAGNLHQIAKIFQDEGRDEDAVDALQQSVTYFAEVQDARRVGAFSIHHASLLITLNRYQEALSSLERALLLNPIFNELNAQLQICRAEVLHCLDQPEAALEALNQVPQQLLSDVKGLGGPFYVFRAKALRELGKPLESLIAIQKAEDFLEAESRRALLVMALILHVQILIFDRADTAGAVAVLERARIIATEDSFTTGLSSIELLFNRVKQNTTTHHKRFKDNDTKTLA